MKKSSITGNSLFIFKKRNKLRRKAKDLVTMKHFDNIILLFIVLSTILLTLENPLDNPNGLKQFLLFYFDIIITIVFTFECVLKILVYGLIFNGKFSYLRNSWNIIDFLIVVCAIVSLSITDINLGFFKAIRMIRVLRPLKVISRNQGLKVAVLSLLNSIPGILNVIIVSLLFFLLFGILGTNFFKGKFFVCKGFLNIAEIDNKWTCLN